MKVAEIQQALRRRYAPPEWAYLTEVGNRTGQGASRHIDGLALNLWPSRGLELHGFEIKTARRDWLRELATPEKADSIAVYCDRWWIVAPESLRIMPDEMPPTWGLLRLTEVGRWQVDVAAPKLDAKPLDRGFVAAVLRRVCAESPSAAALKLARSEGYRAGLTDYANQVEMLEQRVAELEERERQFERITGVPFASWQLLERLAPAVRRALDLRRLETEIRRITANIEDLYRRACELREADVESGR